jgi:hypothetical protein
MDIAPGDREDRLDRGPENRLNCAANNASGGEDLMPRSAWPLAAFAGAFALCACNQDAPVASTPPPPPPPSAPAAANLSGLPPGAPCTAKINRYQSVIVADHQTGNVNDSVFSSIEHDLTDAATACSAGHGGQALALIRASEDRHGYHT